MPSNDSAKKSVCNCGRVCPALDHALECPTRVEYYGGKMEWDRANVRLEGDTRWVFDPIVGAWRPKQRWYIFYQVTDRKSGRNNIVVSGFIATTKKDAVNLMQLAQKMRELHYQPSILGFDSTPETYELANKDTAYMVDAHITENPDTGFCIPDSPALKLYLN